MKIKGGIYLRTQPKKPSNGDLLPKKSRNINPISSKGGLHSIKLFIAVEAKISSLMRRLKAL